MLHPCGCQLPQLLVPCRPSVKIPVVFCTAQETIGILGWNHSVSICYFVTSIILGLVEQFLGLGLESKASTTARPFKRWIQTKRDKACTDETTLEMPSSDEGVYKLETDYLLLSLKLPFQTSLISKTGAVPCY